VGIININAKFKKISKTNIYTMSVASVAQLLQEQGGSGSGNIIYTNYKLQTNTTPVAENIQTVLFSGEIIPEAGTYLINTNLRFEGYQDDGSPSNIITASISLEYSSGHGNYIIINNSTIQNISESNFFNIQSCNIFQSNGTGQIVLSCTVDSLQEVDSSYNVITGNTYPPQIQLIKLI
jgi:hypothetical protein